MEQMGISAFKASLRLLSGGLSVIGRAQTIVSNEATLGAAATVAAVAWRFTSSHLMTVSVSAVNLVVIFLP